MKLRLYKRLWVNPCGHTQPKLDAGDYDVQLSDDPETDIRIYLNKPVSVIFTMGGFPGKYVQHEQWSYRETRLALAIVCQPCREDYYGNNEVNEQDMVLVADELEEDIISKLKRTTLFHDETSQGVALYMRLTLRSRVLLLYPLLGSDVLSVVWGFLHE